MERTREQMAISASMKMYQSLDCTNIDMQEEAMKQDAEMSSDFEFFDCSFKN